MNLLSVSFVSSVVQSVCPSLTTHHLALSTRRGPHPRPLNPHPQPLSHKGERGEGRAWWRFLDGLVMSNNYLLPTDHWQLTPDHWQLIPDHWQLTPET
ncbi:MAG: hypothetical protein BroJett007_30310 [Chloroflexota bacterium]|nr:MAG: hypothetical protein BroJett007_30310 [Chloroflexota bacterium]